MCCEVLSYWQPRHSATHLLPFPEPSFFHVAYPQKVGYLGGTLSVGMTLGKKIGVEEKGVRDWQFIWVSEPALRVKLVFVMTMIHLR